MSKTQIILNRINKKFAKYKNGIHTIKTLSNRQKFKIFRDFVKNENNKIIQQRKQNNRYNPVQIKKRNF